MPTSTVSVVVTTYNKAPYVAEAIASVLAQTRAPDQVIVVDDGSTDGTREILRRYDGLELHLRENGGVSAARNAGLAAATGELVAFLDGDDIWEAEYLEAQIGAALRHPSAGLVVADGIQFSADGVLRDSLLLGELHALVYGQGGADEVCGRFYRPLLRGSTIGTTSQAMLRARAARDVGGFDEALPVAEDWDLYLRIAARHDVAFVKRSLVRWRLVESGLSGPRERRFQWGEVDVAVLEKQLRAGPPAERDAVRAELDGRLARTAQRAYLYGREHDRAWARRYLAGFVRRHPGCLPASAYLAALSLPPGVVHTLGRVRRTGSR